MNTTSYISHRMFVAALGGERRAHPAPPSPPLPLFVESAPPTASASSEEKRRRETVGALALREVLSLGPGNGC